MSHPTIISTDTQLPVVNATGGYEGASRLARELAAWSPTPRSADADLLRSKDSIDARATDSYRNDAYVMGGLNVRRDSIVGAQYVLNAQPDYRVLGADESWAEEFQQVVESKFSLWSESQNHWPDAARQNTFTGLIRLAIAQHTLCGEALGTFEWMRSASSYRPFKTAIQMVDPYRLSNPRGASDTKFLRKGVEQDRYGAPLAYHIRSGFQNDPYMDPEMYSWRRVDARKPWGRLQVIHVFEQSRPNQSRGVSDMVSALKEMRMTKKFRDVTLQSAVLQATYAASIESDLPSDLIWEQMGQGGGSPALESFLGQLAEYAGGAKALQIDGVKIPHLFPGTKLNFQSADAPSGVGEKFEQSLLRYLSRALGLSYEQLSGDYSQSNYSSARASMIETWKGMQSIKKMVADRFANAIYSAWLEEAIALGEVPMPPGMAPEAFYDGLNREALCRAEWIGASRGQIDELKETEAAVMRIEKGLSTYEDEIARTGKDFRRVFAQRARENKLMKSLDLDFNDKDPAAAAAKQTAKKVANKAADDKDEGL